MTIPADSSIRVRHCPKCPLCEGEGSPRYRDLKDRLFGVEGTWNLSQCLNPSCEAIWLDPMPVEEDIPKAYSNYYTHQNLTPADSLARRIYRRAKHGYVAIRYGYYKGAVTLLDRMLGIAIFFHPGRSASIDFEAFYLDANKGGRLLEVGCGSGVMLKTLIDRGWHAEGLDFDLSAVTNARKKGLTVHLGSLESQEFCADTFDAIVMSHLIEHLPNPHTLVKECYRLLKPGGHLVMITPNAESFGHRLYGANWRGLEPPRHLIVFNQRALTQLAKASGFNQINAFTTIRGADEIFVASRSTSVLGTYRMGGKRKRWLHVWAATMQLWEWFFLQFKSSVGEELVLIAKK